jgi:hypothetical protein
VRRWGGWNSIILGGVLLTIVGAGYLVGRLVWATECNLVVGIATLQGTVVGLAAAIRPTWQADTRSLERNSGIALLMYVVVATVSEQFAWASNTSGVLIGIGWLVPLCVGALILLRRNCWFAGWASCALLFAGTTALSYSATHTGSGVGLVMCWME